jgi:hypothetical protein
MIGSFINLSIIILFIRFFAIDTWSNWGTSGEQWMVYALFIFYIWVQVSMQNSYSLDVLKKRCVVEEKDIDSFKLSLYVLFPNVMIFMLVFGILKLMPGWKAPFSNTFGYFMAYTMGINSTFSDLLNEDKNSVSYNSVKMIMQNKSLMINQFTTENFHTTLLEFVKKGIFDIGMDSDVKNTGDVVVDTNDVKLEMDGGGFNSIKKFKEHISDGGDGKVPADKLFLIKKLYSAVVAKDLVAEYLWYILTGCLVITIIKNTMGDIDCNTIKTSYQQ